LSGQPLLARPVGIPGKLGRWCGRNPLLAGAIAALALVLLLGLAGVGWQWRRAEAGSLAASQRAYAADMNLAQQALSNRNLGECRQLLDQHRPGRGESDLRGWEWRYLWSRCRGDEMATFCTRSNSMDALTVSPDGQWLVAEEFLSSGLGLWHLPTRQEVVRLAPDATWFAPDGSAFAAASEHGFGRMWSTHALSELATFGGFQLAAESVVFSPDGRRLAVGGSGSEAVKLWDLSSTRHLLTLPGDGATFSSARFSLDGNLLGTLNSGVLHIWRAPSWKEIAAAGEGVAATTKLN
jgi:eukaryotic-like serine/threonine-protein kinase